MRPRFQELVETKDRLSLSKSDFPANGSLAGSAVNVAFSPVFQSTRTINVCPTSFYFSSAAHRVIATAVRQILTTVLVLHYSNV